MSVSRTLAADGLDHFDWVNARVTDDLKGEVRSLRERGHPAFRTDAAVLVGALRERYARPGEVELTTVPDLSHPLAEEPGLQSASQLPATKMVDKILTRWFLQQLTTK